MKKNDTFPQPSVADFRSIFAMVKNAKAKAQPKAKEATAPPRPIVKKVTPQRLMRLGRLRRLDWAGKPIKLQAALRSSLMPQQVLLLSPIPGCASTLMLARYPIFGTEVQAIYGGSWKATQLRSEPTVGLLMDLGCVDAIIFSTYLEANGKVQCLFLKFQDFSPILSQVWLQDSERLSSLFQSAEWLCL